MGRVLLLGAWSESGHASRRGWVQLLGVGGMRRGWREPRLRAPVGLMGSLGSGWHSGAPVLWAPSFSPSAIRGGGVIELAGILSFHQGEGMMKHVEIISLLGQYMACSKCSVNVCGMNEFKRRKGEKRR